MYLVVWTTTWPNRCTRAGSRAGRCVALVRRTSCPKLNVRLLGGQVGQRVHAGHHLNRNAVRIGQVDGHAAERVLQEADLRTRRAGQPLDVALVVCGERNAGEPRARSAPDDHTGRAGVGATQVQLVRGVQHRAEAERSGEGLSTDQVRLLALQPGQVANLYDQIARAARMLSGSRALLAVHVLVGVDAGCHGALLD